MSNREKFIEIFKSTITREGADKLLEYLTEKTDFFTAPASTRFHGAYEGGLLEHSLNVYECLCDFVKRPRFKDKYGFVFDEESLAIAALLHDICKTNFYKTEMRNVKKNGVWESVPYYTIEDSLPYGHGEKSVYILSGFMKLTRDEAFAIRYHMGFSGPEDASQVGKALEMFPLAFALCVADMEASYYMEGVIKK
jgi:hypothetical protein